MHLLLVRHAIAVPRNDPAVDHARPLTPEGRRRFIQGVAGMGALGLRVDAVWSSPWTRAIQTAELLGPLVDGPTETLDALAAPPSPELLARLAEAPATRLALVGHEPFLSRLLGWLLADDPDLGDQLPLKKGGVAHLEGEPAPGQCALRAHWPPKSLRKMAPSLN